MKLKLDTNNHAVLQDGVPVYVADDGTELALDAAKLHASLKQVNQESLGRRKEIERLSEQVKAFEGLDPQQARDALAKVQALSDKKLLDASEVEKLKSQIEAGYKAKLDDAGKTLAEREKLVHELTIGAAFANSSFLREQTVLPADVAREYFGKHFTVELVNGKPAVIAKDGNGNPIMDSANPAQYAAPEKALQTLVHSSPLRDQLLRSGKAGGGNGPGTTPEAPARPWHKLSEQEKTAYIKAHGPEAAQAMILASSATPAT